MRDPGWGPLRHRNLPQGVTLHGNVPPGGEGKDFPPRWSVREAAVLIAVITLLSLLDKALLFAPVREAMELSRPGVRALFTVLFLGTPIVAMWAMWRRKGVGFGRGFGFRRIPVLETVSTILRTAVLIIVVNVVYYSAVTLAGIRPFGPWQEASEDLVRAFDRGPGPIALLVVGAVILAPLTEEMAFRGVLQSALAEKYSVELAIPLAAVIFGAAHGDPYRLIPLAFTGWMLGRIAWTHRSVVASLALHMMVNGSALLVAYLGYIATK